MSQDIGAFGLRSGMFSLCTGAWNDTEKKYVGADDTQIMECCLDQCKKPVDFCHSYCDTTYGPGGKEADPDFLYRCKETCHDQQEMCTQSCKGSSPTWGRHNPYVQCMQRRGCWSKQGHPIPDCVQEHKDDILNCCRRNCIPSKTLDCQAHCEFSQRVAEDPTLSVFGGTLSVGTPPVAVTKQTEAWKYVIAFTVAAIITGGIWVYMTRRK